MPSCGRPHRLAALVVCAQQAVVRTAPASAIPLPGALKRQVNTHKFIVIKNNFSVFTSLSSGSAARLYSAGSGPKDIEKVAPLTGPNSEYYTSFIQLAASCNTGCRR